MTTDISAEAIARIAKLAEAATPGPWNENGNRVFGLPPNNYAACPFIAGVSMQADAALIAECHTMAQMVAALAKERDKLQLERDASVDAELIAHTLRAEARAERDQAVRGREGLRKDAERYRWMREKLGCRGREDSTCWLDFGMASELDEAVDEALAALPPPPVKEPR